MNTALSEGAPLLWDSHATPKALGVGQRTLARLVKSGAIPLHAFRLRG